MKTMSLRRTLQSWITSSYDSSPAWRCENYDTDVKSETRAIVILPCKVHGVLHRQHVALIPYSKNARVQTCMHMHPNTHAHAQPTCGPGQECDIQLVWVSNEKGEQRHVSVLLAHQSGGRRAGLHGCHGARSSHIYPLHQMSAHTSANTTRGLKRCSDFKKAFSLSDSANLLKQSTECW